MKKNKERRQERERERLKRRNEASYRRITKNNFQVVVNSNLGEENNQSFQF